MNNSKYNGITEGVIWKQLMLFFFPIFFIGGLGREGKVEYTLQGIIIGAILGYIMAVVALLVQSML